MNYLTDKDQWNHFWSEQKAAIQGFRSPLTFRNNGLGFSMVDNQLTGDASVYPYYNETPQAEFIKEVLSYQEEEGTTVADLVRSEGVELRIEPGRSMLAQTGMTVAKVVFRKYDSENNLLVGLAMNRTQLFSSSADFLLDPEVIFQTSPTEKDSSVAGYFVGAYCLEQDIILKRKIKMAKVPAVGDLVCFYNTAGYMMHFYESEAHLFPLSTNLIVKKEQNRYWVTPD